MKEFTCSNIKQCSDRGKKKKKINKQKKKIIKKLMIKRGRDREREGKSFQAINKFVFAGSQS